MFDERENVRPSGLMSIGEFASSARLSHKALRTYDQLGLLTPAHVDRFSGYRHYHPDQLIQARLIRTLREIDMPLATIRKMLGADPATRKQLILAHQRAAEERVKRIRMVVQRLLPDPAKKEHPMPFTIEVEKTPAQTIVSISKQVFVQDLDTHINDSMHKLRQYVDNRKIEAAGAPFGIYHGPINAQEDGPLEVCLPVRSVADATEMRDGVASRALPECTAACVTVRGRDCDFPAIVGAYDAIADWVQQNGYAESDSPREIWLSPPGDNCEMRIAWPFREK